MCAAFALAGAAALAAADESRAAAADTARVVLLHTTDLHGALAATDAITGAPVPRGLSRLATAIRAARAEGAPTVLVDAGDALEGGIVDARRLARSSRAHPLVAAMNALGYDAIAVGNHEFDFGLGELDRARRAARFPFLGANVVRSANGRPAFAPSVVRQAGPVRIGIVGVCTPATPRFLPAARVAGLRFDDPVAAARAEAERLRRERGCDAVVLVAHTGLEPSSGAAPLVDEDWGWRLATQVPGVDVLVLGHSHRRIAGERVSGVLVTQAGKHGEALGRVDLAFTRAGAGGPWRLVGRESQLVDADTLAPDPAIEALARPDLAAAAPALARVVGSAPVAIGAPNGRRTPGTAWELVHRAQLWATGAELSLATLPNPNAAMPRGPVTWRDVLRFYPYGNELEVLELTGAELLDVLEHAAATLPMYHFDGEERVDPGPAFDSVHGLEYAIDLTRPAGSRVVDLRRLGEPLLPDARLRVAVNSYRSNGGGGYPALRGARRGAPRLPEGLRRAPSPLTVRDAIAAYLGAGGWDGTVTARWELLPDYLTVPERPLIDRLVRQGVLERDPAVRLRPEWPAMRGDLERWLDRAFGPGSAATRLPADGVLESEFAAARILERARPWLAVRDAAARESFVRSLATGTSISAAAALAAANGGAAPAGRLTRAQALGMVANGRYPTIRVLETTDFHGGILPGARDRRTQRPLGSSPVLAAWIAKLRAENPEGTVLLDGGDVYQGTMISNLQFGRPVIEQMNALGYAAMAIGNHEFDWSADTLEARVHEMDFAALGANMRERKTGRMPKWARSDTVVVRRGVRVGILGLCYRHTPAVTLAAHVAHLEFLDDSTVAAALAPRVRARSDLVVGVGHVPCVSDSSRRALQGDLHRLARGVRGVDAWFGGHSHNPVVDHVGKVPVAIAGSHGQYVAVCDLVVDPARDSVLESRVRLQETWADSIPPDPDMAARVARWNESVAPIAAQPLGTAARRLTRYRSGESSLGNFVTDAIRAASGADIAMQNSGGLRADLPEGPVTRGTIYEVMPFDNRVFLLGLTGAEVKRAVEQALRSQRITQVSGIRYAFDLGRPALDRVVEITTGDGTPLEMDRVYRVAVNDFMATGGDEYDVLTGGRDRKETDLLVREVLEDHVRRLTTAGQAVDSRVEGRIRRVGETRPLREN